VAEIDYITASGSYAELHVGSARHLVREPLQALEEQLDPDRFLRIHRSSLVPLDRIARIEPYGKDSKVAVLRDGREVPVSKGGYQRLRELMGS
jgi:two-component system LytT family response regulator